MYSRDINAMALMREPAGKVSEEYTLQLNKQQSGKRLLGSKEKWKATTYYTIDSRQLSKNMKQRMLVAIMLETQKFCRNIHDFEV